jgi:hypothetical protein
MRQFLRNHVYRKLGITVIEPDPRFSGQPDEIFRNTLEELEILRQKTEVDLQHLQSRHEFLGAVVKAGPFVIISSFVASGWAFAAQQWMAAFPLFTVGFLVSIVVISCNRLNNEVEITIGNKTLNYAIIEERYKVREAEVRDAVKRAKSKAPGFFDNHFQVAFSKQNLESSKKQFLEMLPDARSQVYVNLKHRHPNSFNIITELQDTTLKFIDSVESLIDLVDHSVRPVLKGTGEDEPGIEAQVQDVTRSLAYCIPARITKKSSLELARDNGEVPSGWYSSLERLFDPRWSALSNTPAIVAIVFEMERLRIKGKQLKQDLERECAILYAST